MALFRGGSSHTSNYTTNNSLSQNFTELLGGNKAQLNFGDGSRSSFSTNQTNSLSTESLADLTGGSGGSAFDVEAVFDTAASVGLGIYGDAQAGAVDKEGGSTFSKAEAFNKGGLGAWATSGGLSPFILAGVALLGFIWLIVKLRKKKRR